MPGGEDGAFAACCELLLTGWGRLGQHAATLTLGRLQAAHHRSSPRLTQPASHPPATHPHPVLCRRRHPGAQPRGAGGAAGNGGPARLPCQAAAGRRDAGKEGDRVCLWRVVGGVVLCGVLWVGGMWVWVEGGWVVWCCLWVCACVRDPKLPTSRDMSTGQPGLLQSARSPFTIVPSD